jgi:hypothetical protein
MALPLDQSHRAARQGIFVWLCWDEGGDQRVNVTKINFFIGIGLLLGFVLVLGITWRISSGSLISTHKPKPSPTPEILENGWYRFTDSEAGYSISYPSNAEITVSEDKVLDYDQILIMFPASNGGDYHTLQIIVYANNERLSLEETIEKKIYQGKPPKKGSDIPLETIEIAGLDATKMEMVPFYPAIFISAKNKVYFISLPMNMMTGNLPTPEAVELFYKMVNTFSLN